MIGDAADMRSRLRAVLPARWFGDTTPVLDGVLAGLAAGWAAIYALLETMRAETRIATASDSFLDGVSADFFGAALPRRTGELDAPFRLRIGYEMLRERGTRAGLVSALTELTGRAPRVFEPALSGDTGGYSSGGLGYGIAGGWGSLALPFQVFVTAYRPLGAGIALVGGYATGGYRAYASLAMVPVQVSDADIYAAAASVMPAATVCWTAISD